LSGTTIVHAETEEGRQACMNDAFQFCQEFIPDRERVFRCLESRKQQISAACRANMPAEPAPERTAAKKLPPTKTGKHKATSAKSKSLPAGRQAVKKHAPPTKSTTAKAPAAKAPSAKRASNAPPQQQGSKPLSLVPR
jgi:hypothetical protein